MKWFCICGRCGSLNYLERNDKKIVHNSLTEQGTLLHPHLIDNYTTLEENKDIKKTLTESMMKIFPFKTDELEGLLKSNQISYSKVTIMCEDCLEELSNKNKVYAEEDDLKKDLKKIYKMKSLDRIKWLRDYNALRTLTKTK